MLQMRGIPETIAPFLAAQDYGRLACTCTRARDAMRRGPVVPSLENIVSCVPPAEWIRAHAAHIRSLLVKLPEGSDPLVALLRTLGGFWHHTNAVMRSLRNLYLYVHPDCGPDHSSANLRRIAPTLHTCRVVVTGCWPLDRDRFTIVPTCKELFLFCNGEVYPSVSSTALIRSGAESIYARDCRIRSDLSEQGLLSAKVLCFSRCGDEARGQSDALVRLIRRAPHLESMAISAFAEWIGTPEIFSACPRLRFLHLSSLVDWARTDSAGTLVAPRLRALYVRNHRWGRGTVADMPCLEHLVLVSCTVRVEEMFASCANLRSLYLFDCMPPTNLDAWPKLEKFVYRENTTRDFGRCVECSKVRPATLCVLSNHETPYEAGLGGRWKEESQLYGAGRTLLPYTH